jgi:hypothetical protein
MGGTEVFAVLFLNICLVMNLDAWNWKAAEL